MIESLATVIEEHGTGVGKERTIRCRIASNPKPGDEHGDKTVYLVDDPASEIDETVCLSFWPGDPPIKGLEKTVSRVWSTLEIPTPSDLDGSRYSPDGAALQQGEELLVRAIPNRAPDTETVYLNVTSFVIRGPESRISKKDIRGSERCPRELYLRHVKNVYPGDTFDDNEYNIATVFRGNAVHRITENALKEQLEKFKEDTWEGDVRPFCKEQLETEFGFQQARVILAGQELKEFREEVFTIVEQLFTDEEFLERVQDADEVIAEKFLDEAYGYGGQVDILLDETPYDIKTTKDPSAEDIDRDRNQLKLYLFVLLLEQLKPGESFDQALWEAPNAFFIYPHNSDGSVRFESVELTGDDVRRFLEARNDVQSTQDKHAPPSTYNRENCDSCAFAHEEWVTGKEDTLPPACSYHCQNERRWPCYEVDGGELQTQCSIFGRCDQRNKYRDPKTIDHYETVRAAFNDEGDARKVAKRIINRFDKEILVQGGYKIPQLSCTGAKSRGTVLSFETPRDIVPAFTPGEVVALHSRNGTTQDAAVYYGKEGGEYLFCPLEQSFDLAKYIQPEAEFDAHYQFSTEAVNSKYLRFLDFAQRRNEGEPLGKTAETRPEEARSEPIQPSDIVDYLNHEQIFVDVPVSTDRYELLEELIRELVSAPYPHPDRDGKVPEQGRRALVLGTNPQLVESAVRAQPEGEHYRVDGTGGKKAIQNDDGYHQIQTRLRDSRSLVSTVQLAESKKGLGGVREIFHRLDEVDGRDFTNRDHSDNFFDVVILLGATSLTEPEFHFLSDAADRVVAIGDVRQSGPNMVSSSAVETGLDVFFEQEFERYRSFPTEEAVSLQLTGEAPPAVQTFYQNGPWEGIEGDLIFQPIEGDESTAIDQIKFELTVPAAGSRGRRLVFDVTDTPVSPMKAYELFEDRVRLDATRLREDGIVVIDEESLYLKSKTRLEGKDTDHHQVVVHAVASELEQFSRGMLTNRIAEKIVTQVVKEDMPDIVVTPFERHATALKQRFNEEGIETPVRQPQRLNGDIVDHAVVSLAVADGIVRPPLNQPGVLYSLLASGRNLTMVGNAETLETKDIFEKLISRAERR